MNILKHRTTFLRVSFLVLLIFLLCSGVLAVKPAVTTGGLLTIIPLHQEFLVQKTQVNLEFHIYNSSGAVVSNTTAYSCYIHIYNGSNRHIVRAVLSYDGQGDWEYSTGQNVSNHSQVWSYGVWCNSSVRADYGFLADSFEITLDGRSKDDGLVIAALLLFLPFLLAFLLMYWVTTLSDQHNVLKLGLSLISVSTFFITLWYAGLTVMRFTNWMAMVEALGFTGQIFAGLLFFIISYFIIYIIVMIFTKIGKDKEEKFNY